MPDYGSNAYTYDSILHYYNYCYVIIKLYISYRQFCIFLTSVADLDDFYLDSEPELY
jgi:hypothetical protein